jgi:hypothetical protein
MRPSDSCCSVSPDSCARPTIPSLRRRLRSPQARRGLGGQEVWVRHLREPTWCTKESGRSLRFLGNPDVCSPCSRTPAGSAPQASSGCRRGPSARSDGGLAARSLISGLHSRAFTLVVYASPSGSLPRTQDSLLAAGQALPGGIDHPQGSSERFLSCSSYSSSPFPKLAGRKNDQVQQRGRLERSHATKSRSAGPVCCNDWFGDVIPLESNPDPFVFLRLSPRVILFARLGAERRCAQHVA